MTATKYGYGDSEIVNMDKVKSLTFKSQVGFKKYFANKDIDKFLVVNQNVSVGTNYGQVNTVNQSSFKSDLISPTIQKNKNPNKQINTKISDIEIASWIFGIIVAILAIYEFIIKNLTN